MAALCVSNRATVIFQQQWVQLWEKETSICLAAINGRERFNVLGQIPHSSSLSSSSLLGRPFRAREGRRDEGMLGESTPQLCSQRCILGKPWSNSLQGMTGWDCLSPVPGQQVPPLVSLWLLEVLLLARSTLDAGCWAVTCGTWNLFPVLQHFLDKSYPMRLDFFI